MKSLHTPSIIRFVTLLMLLSIPFTSCKKSNEAEPCDDTKQPLINATFQLNANVLFSDSIPYQGELTMSIRKVYCEGDISGYYVDKKTTDSFGNYASGMTYYYKFANTKDKVTVVFTLNKNGVEESIAWEEFYYESIVFARDVSKTYYIILPWLSTD